MKKLFAGTYYTFFVSGIMVLMIGAIMPYFSAEYGIDYSLTGILLSLLAIGNLLASFAVSFFISRLGRKKTVIILSSLIGLCFSGIMLTGYPPVLCMMFLLIGIGRGSISNTNNAIINDNAVGKASYLNILHTYFAIGAFITPIAAAFIIGQGYSWKVVVGIGVFFCVTMFVVYCRLDIPNKPVVAKKEPSQLAPSVSFYKNIDFYVASGVLFFYLGAENAVNGWLVTYLKDAGIMEASYAQTMLSILWIFIIVGRLLCAYLSKHIKKTTIILVNACGAAFMFLWFFFTKDLIFLTISIVGFGFFFAGIYPTTIATCGNIIKGSSGAMAVLLAIAGLGGIVAPYIIGMVATAINITAGMFVIVVFIFISVFCSFLLKLRIKE